MSEEHPIGVCAEREVCELEPPEGTPSLDCPLEGTRCLMSADRPAWFEERPPWSEEIEFPQHSQPGASPFWGRCVPEAACAALEREMPGTWECLDQERRL